MNRRRAYEDDGDFYGGKFVSSITSFCLLVVAEGSSVLWVGLPVMGI